MHQSILILFMIIAPLFITRAQPEPLLQISADNITRLESVATIDFADYEDTLSKMATGWFTTNDRGDLMAITDTHEQIYILALDGNISHTSYGDVDDELGHSVIDMKFIETDTQHILASLIQTNVTIEDEESGEESILSAARITYHQIEGDTVLKAPLDQDLLIGYSARAIWLKPYGPENQAFQVFVEASDIREPTIRDVILSWVSSADGESEYTEILYGPSSQQEAGVRIGRIVPPIAVTSTFEGTVKRWNLETGEVSAEAQVEDETAVFGQVNQSGTHFAWRDGVSQSINLLNFETGENQVVAPLDGEYFNWFFVSSDASVILGVTPEERPEIVAWIVESGERILVGDYRECSRQPDMVRLSTDGTTLIIGCDTGLDIWRIVND